MIGGGEPFAFCDEVLAGLLDCNRARAAEERRLRLSQRGTVRPNDADVSEDAHS